IHAGREMRRQMFHFLSMTKHETKRNWVSSLPRTVLSGVLLFAGLVNTQAVFAQSSKLSKDLQGVASTASPDVIVQYVKAPTSTDVQKVTSKGGKLKKQYNVIKGVAYTTVPASQLSSIAGDANVKYITLDRKVKGKLEFAEPATNASIALASGYDGTGVGVAIIDSGITPHNDLNVAGSNQSRIVYSQSFVPGDASTADPYGHGTHVAGIVAANGAMSSFKNA